MLWVAILIGVIILVVAIAVGMQSHNKMVASGEIISRRTNFMENAEIFTFNLADPAQVTTGLQGIQQRVPGVGLQGNVQNQVFQFNAAKWTAKVTRLQNNGYLAVYRFEFTQWKTYRGMAEDALNMNRLTTAVEKMFLSIDPNAQVRTEPIQFNTKHTLL